MNSFKKISILVFFVGLFFGGGIPVFAEEQSSSDMNPVEMLLIDNQTSSSLENVEFLMQLSPQVVSTDSIVDYYFQIQNNGEFAIENARLTHVLPRGLQFIGFEFLDSNFSIETTHFLNDTLIVRGLYLAANMQEPFILRAQALVQNLPSEGEIYNQSVLDVISANGQDFIVSDSTPETENTEEETVLIGDPQKSATADSYNQSVLNAQKVPSAVKKKSSGSGKKGLMWAGMRREDILKPGASAQKIKAFNQRINEGQNAQIKTYIDRSGKVKFYGIIPGRLPANRFPTAKKSRPTYRESSNKITRSSRKTLQIKPRISHESKVRQYTTNFKRPNPKRGVYRSNKRP